MKIFKFFGILSCIIFLSCGLDSYNSANADKGTEISYKVAVIFPMDSAYSIHLKQTEKLFSENLKKAFSSISTDTTFRLEIEWFDENSENISELSDKLAYRDDILAIVGPNSPNHLYALAKNLNKTEKTLIVPSIGAADEIRKYVSSPWFFSLVEPDITQCEMLLTEALSYGAKTVSLLVGNSDYGKTFIDWFAFQAAELGLKTENLYIYDDERDLKNTASQAFSGKSDYVICVPSNFRQVKAIVDTHGELDSKSRMLFSSTAHTSDLFNLGSFDGLEGVSTQADPHSGFEITYEDYFNTTPIAGIAQFYDALMVLALGKFHQMVLNGESLNSSITEVLKTNEIESEYYAWDALNMSRVMEQILEDSSYNIGGASGSLNLDEQNNSIVTTSIYSHWKIIDNKFMPLEYISSNGSKRVNSKYSSWNWMNHLFEEYEDKDSTFSFPVQKQNFALIISTSSGWNNYRHEADALYMYNILKDLDFDDDHIILITDDSIAKNENNPNPGSVISFDGRNLYENVEIDYRTRDLEPEDIEKILAGSQSNKLKKIIDSDSSSDIFIFWTGHGSQGSFDWLDLSENDSFTRKTMEKLIQKLSEEKKFRKMLWITETCFGASVCDVMEELEIPGTMCISAADKLESSLADIIVDGYNTYMTNSFMKSLVATLAPYTKDGSYITMENFIEGLVLNTHGSHVTLLNAKKFGDIQISSILEFISTWYNYEDF